MSESPSSQDSTFAARRALRVLVVEDSVRDAEIIVRELRSAEFDVDWTRVDSEAQYLAALETAPDLILCDYTLPQFDGLRAVDLLVARDLEIPFILVSGTVGEEKAVLSIQRGVDDYLLKDRLARLVPAVRRALEIRRTRRERKLAMVALQRSERAYRQLVHSLPVAVYTTDTSGRVTLFNDAALALWGPLPDAPDIYSNRMRLLDLEGNEIPIAERPTARVLRENCGVLGAEYVLERADLTRRQVLVYPHPIRGEDGTLAGAVSLVLDVTELRQAQQALLASQSLAQATIDSVSAHICVLDETGKLVGVNLAWREYCLQNAPRSEVSRAYLGTNYLNACDAAVEPDASDASLMATGIRQVMNGTVPEFTLEYPSHSPTQKQWFLARVTRFRGAAGNVVVAHENVSDRKLQEQRVAQLSRVQVLSSGINALIVRARDRSELLRDACEIAINAAGFHMAFVGIVDESTGKVVVNASSGKGKSLLALATETLASNDMATNTLVMTAIREKRALISNDSRNDPRVLLGAEYAAAGVRSLAVLPLLVEGKAVGVFVLYSNVTDFFHDDEMKLLHEMAGNVAFSIDHIKKGERLNYLAYYDALTGLPNHTLFLDRVAQSIRVNIAAGLGFSMVVLDLERFAQINDQLGRISGDAVLLWVTAWLTRTLGDANLLMRAAGDQFAFVISTELQEAEVSQFLERAASALRQDSLCHEGVVIPVAAKFGVARFPEDGADAEALLKHAKAALKLAKSSGQMFAYFSNELDVQSNQRLALEEQLRVAINAGQFVLHYQPKLDVISGEIVGAEALIRWQHPDKGLLAPTAFIALAEETGLIVPIGAWVINAVCAQQAIWIAEGLHAVPIAVNVSAVQLSKDFLNTVRAALSKHSISGKLLELELTESALMNNEYQAVEVMQGLRELGSGLALDDFGTGYSSPAYLKRFAFDSVKIDSSFITDITRNPEDASIATAIIAMAHSLHLKVVAEGVETLGQFNYLRAQGCDQIQGFLFSPPVTEDVFASYLRSFRRMHLPLPAPDDQQTLLVVDDEPHISAALFRMLRRDGYRILIAASGVEALEILAINRVQVIISDQRMPEMSGTEFLDKVRQMYPDTIRMILSGYTDLRVVTESVNRGAVFKFLTKPWDDDQLRDHVRDAFRRFQTNVKH